MKRTITIKHQLKTAATGAKKHYRQIILFALALTSVFIIYGNDLQALANEALNNEAYNYTLLMPFFAGFLFYLKKDSVKAALTLTKSREKTTKYLNEIMGAALCIIAFLIYWYGSYTFYPLEYHMLTLPIFIMGITLILLNLRSLLTLIFPILFLLFLVPIPTTLTSTAGGVLANFNTQASYTITKTFLPVTLSNDFGAPTLMLTTAAGQEVSFSVDIPCSGIYSLIAFATFATFLAFISSTTVLKRFLLFVSGFIIFTLLNIVRITTVVSIGYWLGEDAALIVHSFAGFILIFLGMLLLLGISDKLLKIKMTTKPTPQAPCPKCESFSDKLENFCQNCGRFLGKSRTTIISKNLFAKALLMILACSIVVLTINAPTFATAQESVELATNPETANATQTLPALPGYNLTFLYRDTAYEKIAKQDISLVYGYFPPNSSKSVIYVSVGVSSSLQNLHNWEVCLISWQTAQGQYPLVKVLDQRDIQLMQDTPLIARYLVFESPDNYTQVTLYWYEKATFKTGLTVGQKYVRISLIILTHETQNYPTFEEELLKAGEVIAAAWEPLKTQALISLGIPAQQSLLIASIAFLVITGTTQYLTEKRKTASNIKIFNNFASHKERTLLETVQKLAKEKKIITTIDIVDALKERTGKEINPNTALRVLSTLEEQGLIRKAIVSEGNAPRLTWKI
jgi:exosortase